MSGSASSPTPTGSTVLGPAATPPPREVRLARDKRMLTLVWPDATATPAPPATATLDAEYLRVESPSAEVKGHGHGQERLVSGKRALTIAALEPVGNYALRIVFSDGHSTGLYTWDYLRRLAAEHPTRWPRYLADLSAAGLSRDVAAPLVPRPLPGV